MLKHLRAFMLLGSLLAPTFFFLSKASASEGFISGMGKFWVHKDDTNEFVKKHLFVSAQESIMTKALENLGLDSDFFWQKFNEKYEQSLNVIEISLKNSMSSLEGKPKYHELWSKRLRYKKLRLWRRMLSKKRLIDKYIILKGPYSLPDSPGFKYLKIKAHVNKTLLRKMYFEYTFLDYTNDSSLLKVAIDVKFDEKLMNSGHIFEHNMLDYIKTVLMKNLVELKIPKARLILERESGISLKTQSEERVENEEDSKEEAEKEENGPKEDEGGIQVIEGKAPKEKSMKETQTKKTSHNMLLAIDGALSLVEEDVFLNMKKVSLKGNIVVIDETNDKVLFSKIIHIPLKKFGASTHFERILKDYVVRIFSEHFYDVKKKLSEYRVIKNMAQVLIEGDVDYSDILEISKFLEDEGSSIHLESRIDSFDNRGVVMNIFFLEGNRSKLRQIYDEMENRVELENKNLLRKMMGEGPGLDQVSSRGAYSEIYVIKKYLSET